MLHNIRHACRAHLHVPGYGSFSRQVVRADRASFCRLMDGHVVTTVTAALALLDQAQMVISAANSTQHAGPASASPSPGDLMDSVLGAVAAVLMCCRGESINEAPGMVEAAGGPAVLQGAFRLIQVRVDKELGLLRNWQLAHQYNPTTRSTTPKA